MYDWPVCLSTCTHFKEANDANDLWPSLFQRMFVALEGMIERCVKTCEQSLSVVLKSNNFPLYFKHLKHRHRQLFPLPYKKPLKLSY